MATAYTMDNTSTLVKVNFATAKELKTLSGVGDRTASSIIEARMKGGNITEKTFESIRHVKAHELMDFVDFEPNPEFDFSNMGGEDNKVQLDKSLDSQPSLTDDTKDDMSKMLANVGSLVHNKNQDVEVRGHAKQEPPSMDPGVKPKSRAPGAQLPGQYQLPTLPQTPRTQVFAPPDTLSPAVALSTFTPASHPVMSMSTVMTPTAISGYPSHHGQTPGYMSPGQYSQALSGVYPPNHYGMPNGVYGGIPSPYMPQTPPGYPQGYQPMSPYGNYHGQQYGYPPYPYYPIPPPPGYPNRCHRKAK
ncbi:extensin-like [Pecten maximus]|uniref:extensin-like n=1 Tax=Pecten maximus TaxID=6579 RepID=UPI0014589745|nr:extensin-like [Pecten maximus]